MGVEELLTTAALKSNIQNVNLLRFVLLATVLQAAQTTYTSLQKIDSQPPSAEQRFKRLKYS